MKYKAKYDCPCQQKHGFILLKMPWTKHLEVESVLSTQFQPEPPWTVYYIMYPPSSEC